MSLMLTTIDNPFNPFKQFDDWFLYDESKGYHTCSYLARIANVSNDLSDLENENEIDRAINEIVAYNFLGIYKKVQESDFDG